jgi:hypothetical protein
MKPSVIILAKAGQAAGDKSSFLIMCIVTEILNYLDELHKRGVIPIPQFHKETVPENRGKVTVASFQIGEEDEEDQPSSQRRYEEKP